jgi:hypothetical protein
MAESGERELGTEPAGVAPRQQHAGEPPDSSLPEESPPTAGVGSEDPEQPEPEPMRSRLERQQPEPEATGDGAIPLQVLTEAEAEAATAYAGVQLGAPGGGLDEDEDEDSADDDEESAEEAGREAGARARRGDASELVAALDEEERQVAERDGLVLGGLGLDERERMALAADCRAACGRAFAAGDEELLSATMGSICGALGMSPDEAVFFCAPAELWVPGPDDDVGQGGRDAGSSGGQQGLLEGGCKRWGVICALLALLSSGGVYDARCRMLLRRLSQSYGVAWPKVRAAESLRLERMVLERHAQAAEEARAGQSSHWTRGLKVGGAAVLGGAALALTGGAAAPFVGAVLGAVGIGGAVGGVLGGSVFVASMFGAAGAGLGAYKVSRVTGGVEDFGFEPIGLGRKKGGAAAAEVEDLKAGLLVMATMAAFSRTVKTIILGRQPDIAMQAWRARTGEDSHVLVVMVPGGQVSADRAGLTRSTIGCPLPLAGDIVVRVA